MEAKLNAYLKKYLEYSDYAASVTAHDLCAVKHGDIRFGLMRWLRNQETPDIREGRFSTDLLMAEYGMTYPAALIYVDWLRSDPETARSALDRA